MPLTVNKTRSQFIFHSGDFAPQNSMPLIKIETTTMLNFHKPIAKTGSKYADKHNMARAKKNKTSIGCLFWVALILLVLVIFLFNRETIQTVIDETGFMDIVQTEKEEKQPEVIQQKLPEEETSTPIEIEVKKAPVLDEKPSQEEPSSPEEVIALEIETIEPAVEKPQLEKPEQDSKIRRSKLYFIEIMDDGNIGLKSIVRPVYYQDSPLTETIKTLLVGLSGSELNMGLISLIPEQTKLLSISIKDGIAYLNFSDSFRFNSFGHEGYNAQLRQVVYTATEFSNIESVQILIEGVIIDYMGTEGLYIGKPLIRSDF